MVLKLWSTSELVNDFSFQFPTGITLSFRGTDRCIDIFAPGVDILTTAPNRRMTVASGTSLSSPIIAGLGAYLLGQLGAGLDAYGSAKDVLREGLCDHIKRLATPGVIKGLPKDTVNLLAYNGNDRFKAGLNRSGKHGVKEKSL
jgi:subtilisin family serine protease